jgi:hypothetical protein
VEQEVRRDFFHATLDASLEFGVQLEWVATLFEEVQDERPERRIRGRRFNSTAFLVLFHLNHQFII